MKILHVSTARSWRGGEQQIAYLVSELKEKSVCQVVCCVINSPLHKFCEANQVVVYSFPGRGVLDLKLARLIRNVCINESISIVHAHDSHAHSGAVLSTSIFGNRTPVVISRRVDFAVSHNPFSNWKYNYPGIKKIICVSEKIRQIIENDIRDKNKLCVVYDGIDLNKFDRTKKYSSLHEEYKIESHIKLIGNASALADHKDYFTFVDTAELVLQKKPDTRFVIIGDGPEKRNIEKYIDGKKMGHAIFLAGFRKNVTQLLPELDVFLMTSATEGLGSIVLDSFAAGVPVVATEAGGIPEIVIHNKTGLLAPVKNAVMLSENVCAFLDDEKLCKKINQQSLVFVQNFSKKKMAMQTLDLYEDVLKV